ncbi:hypothetical protein B7494_g7648 [Chlorociboria aeruginascens]|nr:hypothetical protein B7494_g7648 [Chlorociboria aeruginascens]
MDQENMTADMGALGGKRAFPIEKASKKSRSKSIGPGGLDALKDTTGNRRKSLATVPHPPPKSILKPTMPPLREIPAHISTRKGSPNKSTPPMPQVENLIDFDVEPSGPSVTGAENLPNPFNEDIDAANETRVILRTEEEQQAAAREREEKEREAIERDITSRRDARRKSLANRRVSFAPEATLHTWDVVVEYQDSTTSSNSTNSTRRASSTAGGLLGSPHPQGSGPPSSDPSEPPSTPPEQVEEPTVTASPAHQRDLHQKRRRRSSGIPPMNFNNPDEAFSSSPCSASSVGDGDEAVEGNGESGSNSDLDDDDGTIMSIDGGETTDMSIASAKSSSSTGSSTRLDEALRQAARQAGTQEINFDENANNEPEDDEEDQYGAESGAEMTMDMTSAVGGILPGQQQQSDDDEMSMDVTRAFGGIISNGTQSDPALRRRSIASNRRQSTRRRQSNDGDETIDLTMGIGGMQQSQDDTDSKDDEDMTMEFTSVIGGVLPPGNASKNRGRSSMAPQSKAQTSNHRESMDSAAGDDTMDITAAIGGIMPSITEATGGLDATMHMVTTNAVGDILPSQLSIGNRNQAKKIMEMETDLGSSPFRADVPANSPLKSVAQHAVTMASETGSPSLAAFRGKSLRRSDARNSITPRSKRNSGTPIKKPETPSKQLTPQPIRSTMPTGKTPPSNNIVMRTSSPKRLFKGETKVAVSTPKSLATKKIATPNKLFQMDKTTGVATPGFILTPKRRVSSGIGIDREGLGSPRVADILDRRGSIGEHARSFVPSQADLGHGVRFQDPQTMEQEIDQEREWEEDRENGRSIMEREADNGEEERDVTLNLKEMISSLTPKKKSSKGRKSLHVGAAKGILGKRPIELDEDDEDEDEGGVKRLKNHQGSPVKNVKLQAPPSKAETTGRLTRTARKSLEEVTATLVTSTPTITSPVKGEITSPRNKGRFKDAEAEKGIQKPVPFVEKEPMTENQVEEIFEDDRIQLQDFLNMTSIRFMELTTTKRRHTIVPKPSRNSRDRKTDENRPCLEDCVAAGAATIPMLELFQHACHELKSYISEGRKTVREIESETFEENPPLFREYISATPDVKVVMDNQLKNVKAHARHLSKGMWYDWRMMLLDTLKDGLFKTAEGMEKDEKALNQQQALLDSVLSQLIKKAEQLETQESDLTIVADELANCDPQELSGARQDLISVEADIQAKKRMIADLNKQLKGREAEIAAGQRKKQVYLEEIRESEKIREEYRGWSSNRVDAIEKEHGWTITGVSGTVTSMTYRKEIELVFDAAAFKSKKLIRQSENSRIDLWYIAANRESNPLPLTAEKEFFLQSIRDHIRGLAQFQTPIKDLLQAVSTAWDKALAVGENIRLLTIMCPTTISKTSDNSTLIKSTLMISPLTTKVELSLGLASHSGETGIDVKISHNAIVKYGERFNESKMCEFLLSKIGDVVEEKGNSTKFITKYIDVTVYYYSLSLLVFGDPRMFCKQTGGLHLMLYAENKLAKAKTARGQRIPPGYSKGLAQDVVDALQEIFLRAKLVLNTLVQQWRLYHELEIPWLCLQGMPKVLSGLYAAIFGKMQVIGYLQIIKFCSYFQKYSSVALDLKAFSYVVDGFDSKLCWWFTTESLATNGVNCQYASGDGHSPYENVATMEKEYAIPLGLEDKVDVTLNHGHNGELKEVADLNYAIVEPPKDIFASNFWIPAVTGEVLWSPARLLNDLLVASASWCVSLRLSIVLFVGLHYHLIFIHLHCQHIIAISTHNIQHPVLVILVFTFTVHLHQSPSIIFYGHPHLPIDSINSRTYIPSTKSFLLVQALTPVRNSNHTKPDSSSPHSQLHIVTNQTWIPPQWGRLFEEDHLAGDAQPNGFGPGQNSAGCYPPQVGVPQCRNPYSKPPRTRADLSMIGRDDKEASNTT